MHERSTCARVAQHLSNPLVFEQLTLHAIITQLSFFTPLSSRHRLSAHTLQPESFPGIHSFVPDPSCLQLEAAPGACRRQPQSKMAVPAAAHTRAACIISQGGASSQDCPSHTDHPCTHLSHAQGPPLLCIHNCCSPQTYTHFQSTQRSSTTQHARPAGCSTTGRTASSLAPAPAATRRLDPNHRATASEQRLSAWRECCHCRCTRHHPDSCTRGTWLHHFRRATAVRV